MRIAAVVAAALLGLGPAVAEARGSHGGGHSYTSGHRTAQTHATHSTKRASGVPRDHRGKIKRDPEQRRAFMNSHPCPATGRTSGACPGYVVDHLVPLKRGGADHPSNMQWQTKDEAKAKDRWE